jgi:hypothetical protein
MLLLKSFSFAQGRVVINEYMPWSGCGTTSEFVELLNFGPGPVNIGCYIVTNGQHAVTIPPNTVILPGGFFVLSGQDILPAGCGNKDSAVQVQLNWNTCNCTDNPIPATGDGFLQDGGSSNEKVVLLDPVLNVIDAVSRNSIPDASTTLTSAALNGGCISKTFNLDSMNITYEALGMSTGKSNSFSRSVDGDCNWIKTPQQSAHATNNTSGNTSSVTYSLSINKANDCSNTGGSITINVSGSNVASYFPMNYTLAYDSNNNNTFDLSDQYSYGIDNTSPTIDINNLPAGKYRITVSSVLGCNLNSFDFNIAACNSTLPVKLISFRYLKTVDNEHSFYCMLGDVQDLESLILEESTDGGAFKTASVTKSFNGQTGQESYTIKVSATVSKYFRLRILDKDGNSFYSPILNIKSPATFSINHLWPNPAGDKINIELGGELLQSAFYKIYSLNNTVVRSGKVQLNQSSNAFSLTINQLPPGFYQLAFAPAEDRQPISFLFVKQ